MGSYNPHPTTVCIIGAGPTGVAFAKSLRAEKAFHTIVVYEQRSKVGGIWNLSGAERSRRIPVPQVDSRYGRARRGWRSSEAGGDGGVDDRGEGDGEGGSLEFESPLYEYLETNIPKQLMAFSDRAFDEGLPLFPGHQAVLEYLEEYAGDVVELVEFGRQVMDVRLGRDGEEEGEGRDRWVVTVRHLTTGRVEKRVFDAVVVANGHYTIPHVPEIKGLRQWSERYTGAVMHSKAYRRPQDYEEKKVLVVGNSASGMDIAAQISRYVKLPVLVSGRSVGAQGSPVTVDWRRDLDEVVEFLEPEQGKRAVRCRSGHVEEDIDVVVFATGYFYSFPFLEGLDPPVVTEGARTKHVYQHLFYLEHPTLVIPVLNIRVVPFPLAENQAAVVSRVWSGRLNLPRKEEMRAWEAEWVERKGDGKHFHQQKFPEDAAQVNELYYRAQSAHKREGLENGGQGKLGMDWDERQVWMRMKFPELKAGFVKKGEERFHVRTMEDLGFAFEKWRDSASDEDVEVFRAARCNGW